MLLDQIPESLRDLVARGLLIVAILIGLWLLRYIWRRASATPNSMTAYATS
jgi:glucose dehydrogenase